MKKNKIQSILVTVLACGSLIAAATAAWGQNKEKILHTFTYQGDGGFPYAGLTFDAKGNLYGVGYLGGKTQGACCGLAFELTPNSSGGWTFQVLHTFRGPDFDGEAPSGSVIFDAAGNLYGTTQLGGYDGCGVVYELSPTAKGEWTETILHSFNHFPVQNSDGCLPSSALIFDPAGNLYGTTQQGGGIMYNNLVNCDNAGCGAVFKLSRASNGKWRENVIYSFPQSSTDGINPYGPLVFDSAGNLWGTTLVGGSASVGTVFKLTPSTSGSWNETVAFTFLNDSTGWEPYAGVVIDPAGNLYGTTLYGGIGPGVVYKLTPQANGQMTENFVHQFATCGSTQCPDGLEPFGGLVIDASGNLYGTTMSGGAAGGQPCNGNSTVKIGCGTVFKLTAGSSGTWTYNILYRFPGGKNGANLTDDHLAVDASGNIFGTAFAGGDIDSTVCPQEVFGQQGCGVVFEISH